MADLETRVAVLEARMEASGSSTKRLVRDVGILQDRVQVLSEHVGDVREEMAQLRGEMRAEFASVRGEMRAEIGSIRGEMGTFRGEIAERFMAMHKEFAVVHRDLALVHRTIANQSKFLLALALGMVTLLSILPPLVRRFLE